MRGCSSALSAEFGRNPFGGGTATTSTSIGTTEAGVGGNTPNAACSYDATTVSRVRYRGDYPHLHRLRPDLEGTDFTIPPPPPSPEVEAMSAPVELLSEPESEASNSAVLDMGF